MKRNVHRAISLLLLIIVAIPASGCELAYWVVCSGTDAMGRLFVSDFTVESRTFPEAVIGQSYIARLRVEPTYQWLHVEHGRLPPGLTVDLPDEPSRHDEIVLRGTPTEIGEFHFTLQLSGNLTMCGMDRAKITFRQTVVPTIPLSGVSGTSTP